MLCMSHHVRVTAIRRAAPFARRLSTSANYAVTPYRQKTFATEEQRQIWDERDKTLHAKMREHVPAALAHNGEEAFDDHLVGVQSVLRSWGVREELCDAALFHSIYGTEGFQGFKLPLTQRAEIASLIGPSAERLAWIFCIVDRASVDETVLAPPAVGSPPPSFRARLELGGFPIALQSEGEWLDFLTLCLADWLEQVEGSARKANPPVFWGVGEAWAYRRDAYAAMASLLGARGVDAAPRMYAEVFAREPEASRCLVQPLTPPISAAAREAWEALASSKLQLGADQDLPEVVWAPTRRETS